MRWTEARIAEQLEYERTCLSFLSAFEGRIRPRFMTLLREMIEQTGATEAGVALLLLADSIVAEGIVISDEERSRMAELGRVDQDWPTEFWPETVVSDDPEIRMTNIDLTNEGVLFEANRMGLEAMVEIVDDWVFGDERWSDHREFAPWARCDRRSLRLLIELTNEDHPILPLNSPSQAYAQSNRDTWISVGFNEYAVVLRANDSGYAWLKSLANFMLNGLEQFSSLDLLPGIDLDQESLPLRFGKWQAPESGIVISAHSA